MLKKFRNLKNEIENKLKNKDKEMDTELDVILQKRKRVIAIIQ